MIGPSNPVISIGPILALDDIKRALAQTRAPVVAVSPLVRGEVIKGPTEAFLRWAGLELSSDGIAAAYDGVIDGLVTDERTSRVPVLETDVLMDGELGRRRLAEETLSFALGLGSE